MCGGTCPSDYSSQRKRSRSCNTQCCPVNCLWTWNSWGACQGCGVSQQTRTVRITRWYKCGGTTCPSRRSETRSCNTGVCCPVNCVVSGWSGWGSCNAACEKNGQQVRTRTVRTQAACRGTPCPTLRETKSCRGPCCPRDCQVNSWGSWGACSEKCAVGSKQRARTIKISKRCRGKDCPTLKETSQCGTSNNGCQHKCSNGVCSCNAGYNLASDKKNCIAKDCKMPTPTYCAPG
ncbi:hypothetical protein OS493_011040 [Desmophyllum pertusum]|uniref:Spondin-like TSP1 domain-containing protein n=1 Tax=Desmophyllum pertusum TaxID=174260 RepID=A0A9W9ZH08_9CNID|nr:hypothetical protein OS493_011040 [Desmophyllum pertusum]